MTLLKARPKPSDNEANQYSSPWSLFAPETEPRRRLEVRCWDRIEKYLDTSRTGQPVQKGGSRRVGWRTVEHCNAPGRVDTRSGIMTFSGITLLDPGVGPAIAWHLPFNESGHLAPILKRCKDNANLTPSTGRSRPDSGTGSASNRSVGMPEEDGLLC
jgi:hypothetical protein